MGKRSIAIAIITMTVLGGFLSMKNINKDRKEAEYVVTETGMPTSYDPLDADSTQNLSVARMLYATPLEISLENELTSSVLEEFRYLPDSQEIFWKVKKDLKFSDGKTITTEDVAFSVSRMAFTRPKFPVLQNIVGLSEWLKTELPLKSYPKGIAVDGQTITIKLDKPLKHPLFRFCLELFSIIPKSCVDLKNNKVTCKRSPSSGPYTLETTDASFLVFKKRKEISDTSKPEQIKFTFIPAGKVRENLASISGSAVIAANEALMSDEDLSAINSEYPTKFLPAARMTLFLLNPKSENFMSQNCRLVFSKDVRSEYAKIQKSNPLESSLFTKIIPGYRKNEDLISNSSLKLSQEQEQQCRSQMKKSGIQWGYAAGEDHEHFVIAVNAVFKNYEITSAPKEFPSRKELYEAFNAGDIEIMTAGTGFWALDPIGDLKMLFTPNLHKILSHVSKDEKLQKLIGALDENESAAHLAVVNQYIYDQALFNVFSHVRRFYFSKDKTVMKEVPFAITSPAPWQVFNL